MRVETCSWRVLRSAMYLCSVHATLPGLGVQLAHSILNYILYVGVKFIGPVHETHRRCRQALPKISDSCLTSSQTLIAFSEISSRNEANHSSRISRRDQPVRVACILGQQRLSMLPWQFVREPEQKKRRYFMQFCIWLLLGVGTCKKCWRCPCIPTVIDCAGRIGVHQA